MDYYTIKLAVPRFVQKDNA